MLATGVLPGGGWGGETDMSSWTSGYISEVSYTAGFYRELTPAILELAALAKSITVRPATSPFAMCELGCGRGLTTNVLAAANPHGRFHATDFNPAHIAEARALATAGGLNNVSFSDASFAEFLDDPTLPQFDIIALHGILSWISEANRRVIVAFIAKHLKPGGLAYVSYNCMPGWASSAPLRRLMAEYGALGSGGPIGRLEKSIEVISRLKQANARYFQANPGVGERLEKLKSQNRNYLVHEYLNEHWIPFYHKDVVTEMSEAKLTFLASANLLDHVDVLNLTEVQRNVLSEIEDTTLRETTRDYMVNQQFRRDIFIKGAVPYSLLSIRERWQEIRFALSANRSDVPTKVSGGLGDADLQPAVYGPFLDALASGPRTLRSLQAIPAIASLGWARTIQALSVMVGSGHVQPCLDEKGDAERRESTGRFNRAVMELSRDSNDIQALASPVTGGGISVDRFAQLFLLARQNQHPDPPAQVWQTLSSLGQQVVRDGKPIETPEENQTELRTRYAAFLKDRLPVLEQLGVA
jgi:SAM-dependent methyltransferase